MKRTSIQLVVASGLAAVSAVRVEAFPEMVESPIVSAAFDGHSAGVRIQPVDLLIVPDANSMRVVFNDWNLGAGSRVVLRSLEDGHEQHLDAAAIQRWSAGSAWFNGDAVEIEVEVAPKDRGVFVSVAGALVARSEGGLITSICGLADNRVASNDARVARFPGGDPDECDGGGGCTAWLFSNGALMTAGHCGPGNGSLVQFNVPLSDNDGTLNHPGPEDQYLVDGSSVVNANSGSFNDWSTFQVDPNTETGLLPIQAQGAFFRGTIDDQNPASIRITGFGFDDDPPGSCNWVNTHKAQQSHAGSYQGYVDSGATSRVHQYRADTRGANSGGPIIMNGTSLTLGIHTNGGCDGTDPEEGANLGPSFRNTALRAAVEDFLGADAVYVDIGHPSDLQFGTVFRPFDAVLSGYNSVPADGTVFLIAGNYTAANGNATVYGGKRVVMRAPSGRVLIGN